MKAAVSSRYGPPEVVRIAEVPRPAPTDDELLVKVHATTVNRTDCGYRAAKPFFIRLFSGILRPKAAVLGTEFAGEVEAVGAGVTSFAVGDRVFGYNEGRFGCHAEYLAIPEHASLTTMPSGWSFQAAAPGTEGAHYAISCIRKGGIEADRHVLVHGATGAIGSAAVQILKHIGAHVTATCTTEHIGLVESLGADRVVDWTAGDFTQDAERYDVVFDAVGKSTFGRCRKLLEPGGLYLSTDLGPLLQNNPMLSIVTRVFGDKRVMLPTPIDDPEIVRYLGALMESGDFEPVVDRTYPLDEIVDAYRYVETGRKVGNVVISVA